MSKYLKFYDMSDCPKVVTVENKKGDFLGYIEYYSKWKQFIFKPEDYTNFSVECLQDIVNKIVELNKS